MGIDSNSRTTKSLKNSSVALILNIVSLILSFFSRKVFLDSLGVDLLGLNTTAMNILQFLNLAELGIGGAISFTLYKPLFDKNHNDIAEILALQGTLYKRIGFLVLIGGLIIMLFFPLIYSKITIPLWYAYTSFSAFLFSALLGYFFNYRQILLSADQKEYVIQYSYRSIMILKTLFQMVAMLILPKPYICWLVLEFAFAIISSVILSNRVNKHFPFLRKIKVSSYKILKSKYSDIITKVKQIFFHKIAAFVLLQTSPLIIYALIDLKEVTLYGNYMLLVNGLTSLTGAIFNGMTAGIGNLIAEGNQKKIKDVFFELLSIRTIIAMIISFSLFTASTWFISMWIGSGFILTPMTVFLISLILFIHISRTTVDSFIWGYGLYKDIWAPVIEASLNLGLSILFGYFWGLNGILSGVLLSLIIIIWGWKPYFLFRNGMNCSSLAEYWKNFIKYVIICIIGIIMTYGVIYVYNIIYADTFIMSLLRILIFSIIINLLFFICRDKGICLFYNRIKLYLRNKSSM